MKRGVRVVVALFAIILAAALAVNISFVNLSPETLSEEDCRFIEKALERFEGTIEEAKTAESGLKEQVSACKTTSQNCREQERSLQQAVERSTKLAQVKADTLIFYDSFCS